MRVLLNENVRDAAIFDRETACTCGFNQVLRAAFDGERIGPVPPIIRRRR